MMFLAPFFTPLITALTWIGRYAFTGAGGAFFGIALLNGIFTFIARASVSLVVCTVIYTITSQLIEYGLSQYIDPRVIDLMSATGITTGINIILSSMQGIIGVRVAKIAFRSTIPGAQGSLF